MLRRLWRSADAFAGEMPACSAKTLSVANGPTPNVPILDESYWTAIDRVTPFRTGGPKRRPANVGLGSGYAFGTETSDPQKSISDNAVFLPLSESGSYLITKGSSDLGAQGCPIYLWGTRRA
jgi:hypothetical protein